MSGGAFEYYQYHISDIAEEIKDVVSKNKVEVPQDKRGYYGVDDDEPYTYYDFNDETIEKLKEGYKKLQEAYIYAQRIDWLLSGDDGEESFHERLEEDLKELEENLKNETWTYSPDDE